METDGPIKPRPAAEQTRRPDGKRYRLSGGMETFYFRCRFRYKDTSKTWNVASYLSPRPPDHHNCYFEQNNFEILIKYGTKGDYFAYTHKEPIGVCGQIIPVSYSPQIYNSRALLPSIHVCPSLSVWLSACPNPFLLPTSIFPHYCFNQPICHNHIFFYSCVLSSPSHIQWTCDHCLLSTHPGVVYVNTATLVHECLLYAQWYDSNMSDMLAPFCGTFLWCCVWRSWRQFWQVAAHAYWSRRNRRRSRRSISVLSS